LNSGVQTELQEIGFEDRHSLLHLILQRAVNEGMNLERSTKKMGEFLGYTNI